MIKEALQYLINGGIKPQERFVDMVDGDGIERNFVVDESGLHREIKPRIYRAEETLNINTLTGLLDYVQANIERIDHDLFIQVYDEKTVLLKGLLDSEGGRETLVTARAIVPDFNYEHFQGVEELIVGLQSNFVSDEDSRDRPNDRGLILKVIGNVKEETVQNTGDDGISQAVTIRSGLSSENDVLVPNPVTLIPYRTFLEIEQPSSEFIFRMKGGPRAAIFEADGGAWRNQAIINVRDYLSEHLKEEIENGRITIIA
ncbi:hypothetical protein [Oceanobacillus indicireducens]|uniref:Uncharacterized protein n=1 Tax=Oceanobacillus indicireducens TaxID=1004261 RepID=A0A917XUY8_9BACI|nr:hypothetical protein [Oceanobacillus indicireducens]GGN54999.1 hypothetical protein GCM10007971_13340 [Oceanobacillus indicireducens]